MSEIYDDINKRTNGEVYIGVVGPVRTGKSTFIKKFMEKLVIPNITDENSKKRAVDELPQAGNGKIIMTTEPKFIPNKAVRIDVGDNLNINVRMVDCVGFVVEGASGYIEDYKERLVKTPWFDEEIPFTRAASIGTRKVINEHSTIGIMVTCDGSFGEIDRDSYIKAEEKTVEELKAIGKPFIIVLNSAAPDSMYTLGLAKELEDKYKVKVYPCNCDMLNEDEIKSILKYILYEFPVSEFRIHMPAFVSMANNREMYEELVDNARNIIGSITKVSDVNNDCLKADNRTYIEKVEIKSLSLSTGVLEINMNVWEKYYYEVLSSLFGNVIESEYDMFCAIRDMARTKEKCQALCDALDNVNATGYGFVAPVRDDIQLDEPEIIKNGNKYGVKIKAVAPSMHIISANLETQIAPIVGTKEQAEDLISYIAENSKTEGGAWDTNIFGKTIEQIVDSGLNEKLHNMSLENVDKIRDTLQKVMNDNSGLVCFIV